MRRSEPVEASLLAINATGSVQIEDSTFSSSNDGAIEIDWNVPRVNPDAYAASHRAISELRSAGAMPHRVRIGYSKYLNNLVEQDHRRIKDRIRPMLGFKRFEAAITISGIELAEKIRKHQFKTGKLMRRPKTAPETRAAMLVA